MCADYSSLPHNWTTSCLLLSAISSLSIINTWNARQRNTIQSLADAIKCCCRRSNKQFPPKIIIVHSIAPPKNCFRQSTASFQSLSYWLRCTIALVDHNCDANHPCPSGWVCDGFFGRNYCVYGMSAYCYLMFIFKLLMKISVKANHPCNDASKQPTNILSCV